MCPQDQNAAQCRPAGSARVPACPRSRPRRSRSSRLVGVGADEGWQVTVELKNDLAITGTLHSVDQHLNIKLTHIKVSSEEKVRRREPDLTTFRPPPETRPEELTHLIAHLPAQYPHLVSIKNCFIRGSVVRYIQIPPAAVDKELLHDATRREARGA